MTTRTMRTKRRTFVLCVKNRGFPASLEVRKIYLVKPDEVAGEEGLLRVCDESGEDYLYPRSFFVPIDVPSTAAKVFALST